MEHLPVEHFNVPAGSELRLEAGEKACFITLLQGQAEVFGAVVQPHRRVSLRHEKTAIFSFEGCAIKLEGFPCEPAYVSDEAPMSAYLNCAHVINNQRTTARDVKPGPVVAVVGPPESGKTSLAKILVNYAIRSGWSPLLVETDVQCNMGAIPGTMAAVQVEVPIEPDEGLVADAPLALFFGHTAPSYNMALYKAQVGRLAAWCQERNSTYQGRYSSLAAGTIIDVASPADGSSRDLQAYICKAFKAEIILVLADDKLHSSLISVFKEDRHVAVVKVPKSGGTVSLTREQQRQLRDRSILSYFQGVDGDLQSSLQKLSIKDVKIFKAASGVVSQPGLLPSGMANTIDPARVLSVLPTPDMAGSIMAVSYAEDPQHIALSNVAGFVWIQQVDLDEGSISVMCPHHSAPPSKYLLLGSIRRSIDNVAL